MSSAESSQQIESDSSPFDQAGTPSTAPSEGGGGWAAFGSDPPAFQSDTSAFGNDAAAFASDPSGRYSHQNNRQQPDTAAQDPPSASWAAFDEPDAGPSQSVSAGKVEEDKSEGATASMQSDQKLHADFGENNFWRTHPLALVDNVD